jgi:hypothetical protein
MMSQDDEYAARRLCGGAGCGAKGRAAKADAKTDAKSDAKADASNAAQRIDYIVTNSSREPGRDTFRMPLTQTPIDKTSFVRHRGECSVMRDCSGATRNA